MTDKQPKTSSQLTEREVEESLYWFNEWPTANGFYWLRGWRHYGDLPISVDGDTFWMMFNIAKNHRTDLDDSEDVQFLGPITPYSGVTAATAMRDKCVEKVKAMAAQDRRYGAEYNLIRALGYDLVVTELQSLTLDQVEQEKQQS